jgi:hypothetical protein
MNRFINMHRPSSLLCGLVFVLSIVAGLSGCKKDDNSTAPVATTITVNGFVKDYDGEPIASVVVIIKGHAPVTTTTSGSFSVSNVTAPYDLSVILNAQNNAITYKGLTRSDPTLASNSSFGTTKNATISGTVPPAVGKTTMVFFVSGTRVWSVTANPTTGVYTINASWNGSAVSYTGTLYVLRWTVNPNGLPLIYDGYGQRALTITAAGSFPNNNFAVGDLTDPADQSISGTINRPTVNYQMLQKALFLNIGQAYVYLAGEYGGTLTDNFSYNVPSISNTLFGVNAGANQTATPSNRVAFHYSNGIAAGSTSTTVNLLTAPQPNLPAHNGTNIDTTTSFLWTAGGGAGVHVVFITPNVGGQPSYTIYTQGTSLTIPNFAAQGLGLPANATYSWQVFQYYPVASVDVVASPAYSSLIRGNGGDFGYGYSETFQFTTKP